jgi:hypothetical protein
MPLGQYLAEHQFYMPKYSTSLFTFTALGVIPTLGVAETINCSAFDTLP